MYISVCLCPSGHCGCSVSPFEFWSTKIVEAFHPRVYVWTVKPHKAGSYQTDSCSYLVVFFWVVFCCCCCCSPQEESVSKMSPPQKLRNTFWFKCPNSVIFNAFCVDLWCFYQVVSHTFSCKYRMYILHILLYTTVNHIWCIAGHLQSLTFTNPHK